MVSFLQGLRTVSGQSQSDYSASIPQWAQPFPDHTCGPNLEYDNAYLELLQAASGRAETQFEPAIAPDWNAVETGALALLGKSRDLRLVALWAEACINLHGIARLPEGLAAMLQLVELAWPALNPPLDDGDAYARLNVIEGLGAGGSFFNSLRNALLIKDPRIGELRVKDFEVLFCNTPGVGPAVSREQVEQFLKTETAHTAHIRQAMAQGQCLLIQLLDALVNKLGEHGVPQLLELKSLFKCVLASLPQAPMEQVASDAPHSGFVDSAALPGVMQPSVGESPLAASTGSVGLIGSRAQALAAIDAVCAYLDHAEPTNPAQLLLRRARRLLDKNFMQLMKDLAPDALVEVAKIMGVSPDSLEQEDL
ncbi:ImpA family type VI secretion system protein [Limnobacter sp.]|uniref:type VI secretion system protein TssA n=1 Tax=Limnobacter sp. TaxID=2003368 RepID=UPI0035160FF9